jgi:hypothetical protein
MMRSRELRIGSAPSADSSAYFWPAPVRHEVIWKPLRLLLVLACSPRQVIQCQCPECFGDARRTELTGKQCARPFGDAEDASVAA